MPTPAPQTCPTPGTYTFPASTIVVTETTVVCAASTTSLPQGTHTVGGITTVVETATTIVCPYATTKAQGSTVTSVIETTTYVCPSAGTYTIAPITVVVTDTTTVCPVPVVTTYTPGTYTAPAVVTVVETDTVVYCPFAAVTPSAAPPAASVAAPAVPSQSAAAKAAPPATLGGNGGQWAITYTPYTSSGGCKSASDVLTDITNIKNAGFTTVRVYSTDCDTLPNVGSACEANGLKVILGIFIGEVGCDNSSPDVADQISSIKTWGNWDIVELVVVANEAIFNGFCTVGQLKTLITTVKTEFSSCGYTGPYTTTDVVSSWTDSGMSELCSVIDVVACNAHAYFNGNVAPEDAGTFVAGQLSMVEAVCNLSGFVMETGWPHAGDCVGTSCAGPSEQAAAMASIKSVVGDKAAMFTWTDDAWKQPGDCNCEQSFGCSGLFA